MDAPVDEFSFLAQQAADAGLEVSPPPARRVTTTLSDGRLLSALRYGDAPPAVTFLHGAGLNAHTWDTTILALGLPALAIDLPGHGDSSWRSDLAYGAHDLAPDVSHGLAAFTDAPQLLVGQSLGGLVAAAVAASRPDLVHDLVVIDITPGIDPRGNARLLHEFFAGPADWASREELTAYALSFGFGGTPAAAARGVFHNSRIRADGRVEWKHHFAHLARGASTGSATEAGASATEAGGSATEAGGSAIGSGPASLHSVTDLLQSSGWNDLAAVQAPLLLIRGDRGYVTDAETEEFARHVPAASIETVASGHNVQEELPVELGRRLSRRAAGKG